MSLFPWMEESKDFIFPCLRNEENNESVDTEVSQWGTQLGEEHQNGVVPSFPDVETVICGVCFEILSKIFLGYVSEPEELNE